MTKKAVVKKQIVKKAAAKKATPKKVIAKKAIVKKAVAKKASPKKVVAKKKAVIKAVPAKVVVKPASPAPRKETPPVQLTIPAVIPAEIPLPTAVLPAPDDLVGKADNIETDRPQMMVPGDGLDEAPAVTENPSMAFDRNVFNKATAKGDPHSSMQISSVPKGSKKPSGKKPLWRK